MIEKLKTYSSTVTAIFSAAVVLYGVIKFIDTAQDNATEIERINSKMITKADVASIVDSVLTLKLTPLKDSYITLVTDMHKNQSRLFEVNFDKWIQYMNGVKFSLEPIRQPDSIKIRITPLR